MKIITPKFLWSALAVSVFLALTIGSCKKDKFVETPGVCPVVTAINPLNGALAVPLDQVIVVQFNEELNPATINAACFELKSATNVEGVLTYNNQSASMSFVPNAPLSSNTTYTGIVKTSIRDMRGNALQREYIWSFSTGIILAPVVTFTEPFNAETGVVLKKIIKAHFSVPMDPTSIMDSSFTLMAGAVSIPGVVTYLDSTAVFTPTNDLIPNTVYTATITTMAKTLGKTNLANNYVWDFTTLSLQAPYVTLTNPVGTSTNVPLNQVVTASFNVPMDPLSIKDSSFKLMQGANFVLGSVTYTDTTASFTPSVSLLPNTLYTARITNMAQDIAGTNMVSDFVWTFTTASVLAPTVFLVDPINLATNVPINKVLTATFSEPMNAATITTSSFTVKLGVTPVTGIVSYSGTTATFTPSSNLLSGNTYTATITTLAKNLAGTPVASNFVWTFNTKAPAGPLPPDLLTVARFGIIAGVGVNNNAGFSVINNMDVGISPGVRASVNGFPPAIVVGGAIYASDDILPVGTSAMLLQAKLDLTAAYLFAKNAVLPAPATVSGDQGGLTLAPGIYKSTSTLLVQNGNLTLDAQGDVNAVWIFQVASSFTTIGGSGGSIILTNGAQAKNIFWQVGSSVTIGDNTAFKGNLLALTSITLNSNATLQGRVLCSNGSIVLTSTNILTKP